MPFLHVVQALDMNSKSREELLRELNFLRTEIDDIRTKYLALCTKLDADAGVTDTNYAAGAGTVLAAAVFTKL